MSFWKPAMLKVTTDQSPTRQVLFKLKKKAVILWWTVKLTLYLAKTVQLFFEQNENESKNLSSWLNKKNNSVYQLVFVYATAYMMFCMLVI